MTNQILGIPNLKAVCAITAIGLGVNVASCQVSRLVWFLTREAFHLASSAALVAWHSSQLQVFTIQHVLGCPLAAVSLLRSILQALVGVL